MCDLAVRSRKIGPEARTRWAGRYAIVQKAVANLQI